MDLVQIHFVPLARNGNKIAENWNLASPGLLGKNGWKSKNGLKMAQKWNFGSFFPFLVNFSPMSWVRPKSNFRPFSAPFRATRSTGLNVCAKESPIPKAQLARSSYLAVGPSGISYTAREVFASAPTPTEPQRPIPPPYAILQLGYRILGVQFTCYLLCSRCLTTTIRPTLTILTEKNYKRKKQSQDLGFLSFGLRKRKKKNILWDFFLEVWPAVVACACPI